MIFKDNSFEYGLANTCSPNDSFYNAGAGSYLQATVFNMFKDFNSHLFFIKIHRTHNLLESELVRSDSGILRNLLTNLCSVCVASRCFFPGNTHSTMFGNGHFPQSELLSKTRHVCISFGEISFEQCSYGPFRCSVKKEFGCEHVYQLLFLFLCVCVGVEGSVFPDIF